MTAKSDWLPVDFVPTYDNMGFYGALHEFHTGLVKKFKEQHPDKPVPPGTEIGEAFVPGSRGAYLRSELIREEASELIEALAFKGPEEVLKECMDLIYVTMAIPVIYKWKAEKAFELVHKNNMDKLNTGTFAATGKLKKHRTHPKPDLTECI